MSSPVRQTGRPFLRRPVLDRSADYRPEVAQGPVPGHLLPRDGPSLLAAETEDEAPLPAALAEGGPSDVARQGRDRPTCPSGCASEAQKNGLAKNGAPRWRCATCRREWREGAQRPDLSGRPPCPRGCEGPTYRAGVRGGRLTWQCRRGHRWSSPP